MLLHWLMISSQFQGYLCAHTGEEQMQVADQSPGESESLQILEQDIRKY